MQSVTKRINKMFFLKNTKVAGRTLALFISKIRPRFFYKVVGGKSHQSDFGLSLAQNFSQMEKYTTHWMHESFLSHEGGLHTLPIHFVVVSHDLGQKGLQLLLWLSLSTEQTSHFSLASPIFLCSFHLSLGHKNSKRFALNKRLKSTVLGDFSAITLSFGDFSSFPTGSLT